MSNELERVAQVIRPWLSQTMQDPDDWAETRARDIAADVIAHALTPTPQVVKVVETVAKFCALDGGTWVKLATGQTGQARDCLVWYGDYGDQTDGSLPATVLYPLPTPDGDLRPLEDGDLAECDWGGCNLPSVAMRRVLDHRPTRLDPECWLAACRAHSTSTPDVLAEVRAWRHKYRFFPATYNWQELDAILDREAGR